jgi:D-3-phosphoglycerate dehydrogenase
MTRRILVADPIAEDGIRALGAAGQVDVRTGMKPAELQQAVDGYHALVVRSESQITRDVLYAASCLQVVGRAGVGVDNIDLEAATERGIVVVNAPTGNTISAAEHTIALMMALARNIPGADRSLKGNAWLRKEFTGVEVRGKTLGLLGLGQVGSEVARRAAGLEMHVIAHDPFVTEERATMLAVELVSLEELLATSDFISVHTTLTTSTRGLIGEEEIAQMKAGVRLINTARGGIIEEQALVKAVDAGQVAGAAVDVFAKEPPEDSDLLHRDAIIVTPHLGASTAEAQERVALDVANEIIAVLNGESARYAVNAPMIPPETLAILSPYMSAATMAGSVATQLNMGQVGDIGIEYYGEIAEHDVSPLKAAVIKGLLQPITTDVVNVVNATHIAQTRGMRIYERKMSSHEIYTNLVQVRLHTSEGEIVVGASVEHGLPHITEVNGMEVDITTKDGLLLVCDNQDRPGMIGAVGMMLARFDINISSMKVGRRQRRDKALMVLGVDEEPTAEQLAEIAAIPNIYNLRLVRLGQP